MTKPPYTIPMGGFTLATVGAFDLQLFSVTDTLYRYVLRSAVLYTIPGSSGMTVVVGVGASTTFLPPLRVLLDSGDLVDGTGTSRFDGRSVVEDDQSIWMSVRGSGTMEVSVDLTGWALTLP